jgi:glycosyltransferase involved in cell wall biosynthesis
MRVLITTDTIGGVWTFTQELAKGLLDRGCSVVLVSMGRYPSAAQQQVCDAFAREWREHFCYEAFDFPLEWMAANCDTYEQAGAEVLRIAKKFGAELLHSNQFCFGALPLPVPKVITAHSDVLSWADACRDGVLEESEWLWNYRTVVAAGLCGADAVVTPTRWMMKALLSHFDVPDARVVIPNGRHIPEVTGGKQKLQAITVGRLWDEAKQITLLREVSSPIPILLAGEVRHGRAAVAVEALDDTTLLGPLNEQEILASFRESAIYICTSRYEPFGLAPLEAALCGCAVVAHDIPSLREVWAEDALYFRDATTLSHLLRKLHDDPQCLHDAQRRAACRARYFTAERMTESYLALFSEVREKDRITRHAA